MKLPASVRNHLVSAALGVVLYLIVAEAVYLHFAVAKHSQYIQAIIAHLSGGPVS